MDSSKGIELDYCGICNSFVYKTLHPVEKLLVSLSLLTRHILVKDLPKFCQDRTLDALCFLVCVVNHAKFDLVCEILVLGSSHLEFKFFFRV